MRLATISASIMDMRNTTAMSTAEGTERISALKSFADAYAPIHEPLVMIICIVGIPSHIACIITLSGKRLFSATNVTLISLSASQLLLIMVYIFVTLYKYATGGNPVRVPSMESYTWATVFLYNVNLQVVFHTIAVWHVVCISIVRYITIGYYVMAVSTRPWFTVRRALLLSAGIYVLVTLVCTPFYMSSVVQPQKEHPHRYKLMFSDREVFGVQLAVFNFWMFAIVGKLLPCFLILVMTALLILKLHELQMRAESVSSSNGRRKAVRNYRRTTHMILSVMILFVIIELPQGVMALLCGLLNDPAFRENVYNHLSDVYELLTVFYSCVNFLLFAFMNGEFRRQLLINTRTTFSFVGIFSSGPDDDPSAQGSVHSPQSQLVHSSFHMATFNELNGTSDIVLLKNGDGHEEGDEEGEEIVLNVRKRTASNTNHSSSLSSSNASITQEPRNSDMHLSIAFTMTSAAVDGLSDVLPTAL